MPFMCPECGAAGSLEITSSIELPPDAWSDEITLQIVECFRCGFRGAAAYEESRRGSLDSEAWRHRGHRMRSEALAALAEAIAACPEPRRSGCPCASHQSLGRTDDSGQWIGIIGSEGSFPMRSAIESGA